MRGSCLPRRRRAHRLPTTCCASGCRSTPLPARPSSCDDTTIVVPPGWARATAAPDLRQEDDPPSTAQAEDTQVHRRRPLDASPNRRGTDDHRHAPPTGAQAHRVDPITVLRDRGRPQVDRDRDGLPPGAHVVLVDHPRVRGLRLRDLRRRRPRLAESTQSTPLQSGPIPGYLRGINRRFAELGDTWKPGDVVVHNHPYYGASHRPTSASSCRSSSGPS